MVVYARSKSLPISPQKMNLVLDLIRGKDIAEARKILTFSTKKAAGLAKKALNSAVADAKHNEGLREDELKIVEARADKAPTLKRIRPRARGRADRILKRRTHLTIGVGTEEG
ncbi:MAG: 50S ribosomal protein L22 [Patescibacteria group bacterium]|nr:50S ribosomal protein L22 [Patescibacteria group bacterium]